MTALAIKWLWWIFATFGVAGLVAFWFLAPTAAQLALQIVVRAIRFVLSYRIGCALLAAIAAGLIADHLRHTYDDEQFAQRTAAFVASQDARDKRVAEKTRGEVLAAVAAANVANNVIDKDVKGFSDALPPPTTGNPFLIGDADADRLCVIAYGKAGCRSSGSKGVSEARRASGSAANSKIRLPSFIRTGTRAD